MIAADVTSRYEKYKQRTSKIKISSNMKLADEGISEDITIKVSKIFHPNRI